MPHRGMRPGLRNKLWNARRYIFDAFNEAILSNAELFLDKVVLNICGGNGKGDGSDSSLAGQRLAARAAPPNTDARGGCENLERNYRASAVV